MDIKSTDMNTDAESNNWYIFKNCNKHGPLTALEVGHLLVKNQITKDHHIWHAKYNNWVAIKDVDVFKNIGFDLPLRKEQEAFIDTPMSAQSTVVTAGFNQKLSFWQMIKKMFS